MIWTFLFKRVDESSVPGHIYDQRLAVLREAGRVLVRCR